MAQVICSSCKDSLAERKFFDTVGSRVPGLPRDKHSSDLGGGASRDQGDSSPRCFETNHRALEGRGGGGSTHVAPEQRADSTASAGYFPGWKWLLCGGWDQRTSMRHWRCLQSAKGFGLSVTAGFPLLYSVRCSPGINKYSVSFHLGF